MAKPKAERNRLFIEDWKRSLTDQSLAKKYGLSIGGVKGLKARLRTKDPSLYTRPVKGTSTSTFAMLGSK